MTASSNTKSVSVRIRAASKLMFSLASLLVLALLAVATPASAQTCTFKPSVSRITVPLNFTGVMTITNLIGIGTNGVAPDINGFNDVGDISLSATGVPSTPVGLTFSITDPNSLPVPVVQGRTNTSGFKTNVWLNLNLANVAEGLYTISFNANGGATNNVLLNLQVGYLWAGGTNAPLNGPAGLTTGTPWIGGIAPGVGDDAIFGDGGGQTNNLVGYGSGITNLLTNIVVTANTTLGSMRFSSTNTPTKFYNIQINDGVTLSLTGSNGLSQMKDSIVSVSGDAAGMTTTFAGTNGTLVVSNETANIFTFIDNANASTLDLSLLGTFRADVSRVGLSDYTLWPFYRNLNDQNAFGGIPRQSLTTFNMARTNFIKAVFVDPYNYTNPDNRTYSVSWMKSAELSGSSTPPNFNLGLSNVFNVDSALFIGANSRGSLQFNTLYVTNIYNPICLFRGTNGASRMSVFTVADGGATNTANSNVKSTVNFTGGTLDMLVDRFYLGRDRKLIVAAGTPNYQATMTMGRGIIDANNAIFGFREYNQTNQLGYAALGYAQGMLTILSNGVFKVNNTLWLSYSVATNANDESTGGNTDAGQLTVLNGGTAIANTVNVGGPSYLYGRNNFIIVSNFSTLAISNTLASTNEALDTFTLEMNSTNQMQVDGTHTGPYFYITNFVTAGSGNVIRIASVKNETFPVQVPLIQYQGGSHSGLGVVGPPGFTCNLVDNGAGSTIDVVITTNAPKNLLWRAYVNSTWDNTTANWLDLSTGLHTNFANGDFASFDDSPVGGNSTISLDPGSSPIVSSGIGMTNTLLAYTIGGGGNISGSVLFTKMGTNSLDIEAATTAFIQLNQGQLTGLSGSIGGAITATNTIMYFLGNSSGSISCAGVGSINGTVSGSLATLTGGIFTNLGSGNINGQFSTAPGSVLVNQGTINAPIGTTSVISSNSFFLNQNSVNADVVTVDNGGTLEDTSGQSGGFVATTVTLNPSITVASGGTNVTYPGATFIPGGPGIGTTWVYGDSQGSFPGRLSLFGGSTTYINVDFSNPQKNTQIYASYQDFGPSQSVRSYDGCTLVITNINPTAGSFAAGQVFNIFNGSIGGGTDPIRPTGSATNSYPNIIPAAPGNGLAWDLSQLYPNGLIGIISVPTTGTHLGFSSTNFPSFVTITSYTTNNSIVTTNFATNNVLITALSWPSSYIGWKLQQQADALNVGLGTNWATVLDASFTNYITFTNAYTTNSVFYRMTYP